MTSSEVSTATHSEVLSASSSCGAEELVRLRALERSVISMTEMLSQNFWDVSNAYGVAGSLHVEITRLWVDMEGLGEQLRLLTNSQAQS